MDAQLLALPSLVPSVSLLIKLASPQSQIAEDVQVLSRLLGRLELPATWVVSQPNQVQGLAEVLLANAQNDAALVASARSPQRLRSELVELQSALQAATGKDADVVVGVPQQLRSRAALLAELGINAVVADPQLAEPGKPARSLPCGLWLFDSAMTLPQRSRWAWLPKRRPTIKQLLASSSTGKQKLICLDLSQSTSRDLQGYGDLLQGILTATSKQQLMVTTVSQLAVQLASENEVKPQRSILRRAA